MNNRKDLSTELDQLQQKAGAAQGKKYWRSLEELAETDSFQELMRREFPEQAELWPDALNRRQFLTLMGASLALAGLSGCSVRPAPQGTIVPYVRPPEEVVPGRPLFYATAMTLAGNAVGLLVESHMGRPTKIEGNPDHPASLGATDLFNQASILTLYDPDRSQNVIHLGHTRTWNDALTAFRSVMARHRRRRGAGLRILTETVVSPTLGQQLQQLCEELPDARWHQYEPLGRNTAYRGAVMAFGEDHYVNTYYKFHDLEADRRLADVVVSLDADFLTCGPGHLRYVREFMAGRRIRTTAENARQAEMNRLYMVETTVTNTGAKADHRLALRASEIELFTRALAAELQVPGAPNPGQLPNSMRQWVRHVADDLRYLDPEGGGQRNRQRPRGTTLVIAGDRQPAAVHTLVHAINQHLGNVGHTVIHTAPIETRPVDQMASLRELIEDMDQEHVETLLILGGNPVFTAPTDLRFRERMQRVPLRIHLSMFNDETSHECHWHLPETHYLESWSDTRAFDGTASIVQPLIEPLYEGRSAHKLLSMLSAGVETPGREIIREHWRNYWNSHGQSANFEEFWQVSVHDGIVADTSYSPQSVSLQENWQTHLGAAPQTSQADGTYELVFQPDPTIYDGRFANNGWLQELPKPITKLTWDNAAIMSPATARQLGVSLGSYGHGGEHGGYHPDVVELQIDDRTVQAPIWIMPGHADGSVTVYLGYGREHAGRVGGTPEHKVGFNAYSLRTADYPWFASGLTVRKTGETYLIACTQQHHLMENRATVRTATLDEYHRSPEFAAERTHETEHTEIVQARRPLSMYEEYEYPEHRWGMAIDLTTCTGCKACVVACQSENNIPVVGKEQVSFGREMHWLEVDRYMVGPADNPTEFYFQPVPCMHCENAPCEYVCPVEATVHSAEGLNDMVYQRCVGTRFCSNNCPYKVRRFNFFHFADYTTESLRQQYNPDVTVRSRGVMEKCSYCVQRIRQAEIDSQVENRSIFDGEILTACQAACPAQAIVFGDINDANSTVKHWKDSPLNYALLGHLNTNPRTTYLSALRNPNPDMEAQ